MVQAIDKKVAKQWVKGASKVEKDDLKAAKAADKGQSAEATAAADGAAAKKPKLQIGGLKHNPETFKKGEAVKSTVTVSNNGDDDVKIKLSLYVNEALADVSTVAVKAGKSKDSSFKWTAQEKNKLNIRGELVK
jgi:hypothetical protein